MQHLFSLVILSNDIDNRLVNETYILTTLMMVLKKRSVHELYPPKAERSVSVKPRMLS
jgi:hypothetical protein